jgi:uncharacterized protein (TIGR02145 family)
MKKIILLFTGLVFFALGNQAQTVTDIDGNVYNTITIGTQIWMVENLKTTKYRNGDTIPNVSDSVEWINLTSGGYCNYNNDTNYSTIYGHLYNWLAINDSRKIAPLGWHVPSDEDWSVLETFLGDQGTAGGKLKETDTLHWQSPNAGATNETGFTALPGGVRGTIGQFGNIRQIGYWWSSTEYYSSNAWGRFIFYDGAFITRPYTPKIIGYSIRCLKDSTTQINEFDNNDPIQIYPDPARDRIFIDLVDRQNFNMQLFNIIGECVMKKELTHFNNEIDISFLPKGVYIIKITDASSSIQQKLVKE